jgi:hypothetical protein
MQCNSEAMANLKKPKALFSVSWGHGSSGRAPSWQVQNLHTTKQTNKQTKNPKALFSHFGPNQL